MATPGTTKHPKGRHNLTISDHAWEAIRDRAHDLHIPAGELIERAFVLIAMLSAHPRDRENADVLLLGAKLTPEAKP